MKTAAQTIKFRTYKMLSSSSLSRVAASIVARLLSGAHSALLKLERFRIVSAPGRGGSTFCSIAATVLSVARNKIFSTGCTHHQATALTG